jgi:hypothetical protein
MNGEKERLMILDMIAEGKITAEEAEELLRAMEIIEEPAPTSPGMVPPLSHLSQLTSLSAIPSSGPTRSQDLAAALKEAGIDHVTLSDVQELQSNRITAEYIREMFALGLRPDGLSEWIDLRNHGVTPRYVRELREMGITGFDVDELTELRDHGVSAKYIASLHQMGLKDFDLDELVELSDNSVSAKYIAELRQAGFQDLEVD